MDDRVPSSGRLWVGSTGFDDTAFDLFDERGEDLLAATRVQGGVLVDGLAYDAAGGELYASALFEGRQSLGVIELATGRFVPYEVGTEDYTALAVSPRSQELFAMTLRGGIDVVDTEGWTTRRVREAPLREGTFHGLAIDDEGTIYASETGVETAAGRGSQLHVWSEAGDTTVPLDGPRFVVGLDFGPDGSLYMTDNHEPALLRRTSDGTLEHVQALEDRRGHGSLAFAPDGSP